MDGRFLAAARERLAAIKAENEKQTRRRREEIYRRLPEIKAMDARLREIMLEVFGAAMGRGGDLEALENESLDIQMRRAEALVAAGYPSDYLDEICSCPRCRDTGYVMGRMCSCLRALYDEEAARSLSSLMKVGDESFEKFRLDYYDATVDPAAGISPRRCMETVLETCRVYAARFAPGAINLLFRGGPGLGKTFLSACVARVVAEKGFSVVYEPAGGIVEAWEDRRFARFEGAEEAQERLARIMNSELLIVDDLGTEPPGGAALSALYAVIDGRIGAGRSMMISTNLPATEVRRRYGEQLASRIEGEFHELRFYGRDIRQIRKERSL